MHSHDLAVLSDDASMPRSINSTGISEMSFRKSRRDLTPEEAERAWFAGLLWKAFPEAGSENELAALAADVLTKDGRPIDARTVRNWLRRENSPHFRYVLRVLAIAGAESLFQIIDPEVPQ
jgi:hypothetical protein